MGLEGLGQNPEHAQSNCEGAWPDVREGFTLPEGRETPEAHPSTARGRPTLLTICQNSTAPSFVSCQPEAFSPNAAGLLVYENISCLSLGLETSVRRQHVLPLTPEGFPNSGQSELPHRAGRWLSWVCASK